MHTYILYIHTCIHTVHTYSTYTHTYIHTYIHAYIRTCVHTYMHICIHTYTYIHTYIHRTFIFLHAIGHTCLKCVVSMAVGLTITYMTTHYGMAFPWIVSTSIQRKTMRKVTTSHQTDRQTRTTVILLWFSKVGNCTEQCSICFNFDLLLIIEY